MTPLNNNSGNDGSTPEQPRLEQAPTGMVAGRDVTAYNQNQSAFFCLPDESKTMIIRYLGFRDITRLVKVCKYFRDLVENHKALERAWYQRFPSPHLYQLKTIATTKDEQQLRDWLKPFANKDTVESLVKKQQSTYFPALLLFNNSKLMSQCETFNLVTKTEITHPYHILIVTLSADGRHLVTACLDNTVKICSQETDGSWKVKASTPDNGWVQEAIFSTDNRHVLVISRLRARIYGMKEDGSWEAKATISHNRWILSAAFSADGRHALTASLDNTLKIYGQKTDGSWEAKYIINCDTPIRLASFSADGRHLLVVNTSDVATIYGLEDDGSLQAKATITDPGGVNWACLSSDGRHALIRIGHNTLKICSQEAIGSWEVKATINHNNFAHSHSFSDDCRHLATASFDNTAKICDLQDDGSWKEITTISHDHFFYSVKFSADSRHLVTGSDDNTAQVYGQETPGSWVKKATIKHNERISSQPGSAPMAAIW
ncbi:F-box/WD repeat-containing protein [Endozoicomonas sp. ALC066]|uniref:F-box/WD repeat-containing protein n=1 Tax=Endozoicomonas sp. ALC066 TaxID=3403078 RepID=UPI003BB7C1E4